MSESDPAPNHEPVGPQSTFGLLVRGGFGGALMGLANLVPGISGGTMLLATGIYPRFISGLGELTRLRFLGPSLLTVGAVALAAVVAIGTLAGPVKELVVTYRWVMYSLFVGLTLGGLPLLWRLIGPRTASMWIGAGLGFVGMAILAIVQSQGVGRGGDHSGALWMGLAGAAAASAMILPGVSGGYLLLILGVYVPLLGAIEGFKNAATASQWPELWQVGYQVILPVGIGVILGVGGVSNLLKWLLDRWPKPTLGVLLGLLLGAVVGLFPFQRAVPPEPGDTLKGQTVVKNEAGRLVLEQSRRPVRREDYPIHFYPPSFGQAGGALGLILAGFAATWATDYLGRPRQAGASDAPAQETSE